MNVKATTAGFVMAGLVSAGAVTVLVVSQPAPVKTVQFVAPAPVATITPCKEEDGSGQALPCRWDASVSGNGVGLSFTVRRATDGGTNYIYDNGKVDHVPPA